MTQLEDVAKHPFFPRRAWLTVGNLAIYVRHSYRHVDSQPASVWIDVANIEPTCADVFSKDVYARGFDLLFYMRWLKKAEAIAKKSRSCGIYIENVLNEDLIPLYLMLGYTQCNRPGYGDDVIPCFFRRIE